LFEATRTFTRKPLIFIFTCIINLLFVQDAGDRSIAVLIYQSLLPSVQLELFPKSTIDVFLTIIENDGIDGCVAAGAVAASTALADAGIEMLGLVISCAAVRPTFFPALVNRMANIL
jgi:exosome complex component MTR3